MSGAASRFIGWRRWPARALLAGLLVLCCFGALLPAPADVPGAYPIKSDAELYRMIERRVAGGENYYAAATDEQRLRHYPLKPFVTVRTPVLSTLIAAIGGPATGTIVLTGLVLAALLALVIRLYAEAGTEFRAYAGSAIAAFSLFTLAQPTLVMWHEIWATVMIALGLAIRTQRRWGASLVILLTAALLRELAMPMLAVMAFAAFVERTWREGMSWLAGVAAFGIALGTHAAFVSPYVLPGDLQSPGWSDLGGWRFILLIAERGTLFGVLPHALISFAVPLTLLGWASWDSPTGLRGALFLFGCTALFMVVGRPDNFYWGAMFASLLPIGLAFVPSALTALARAAR